MGAGEKKKESVGAGEKKEERVGAGAKGEACKRSHLERINVAYTRGDLERGKCSVYHCSYIITLSILFYKYPISLAIHDIVNCRANLLIPITLLQKLIHVGVIEVKPRRIRDLPLA